MENFEKSVSVDELIKRYHEELMRLKDAHSENVKKTQAKAMLPHDFDGRFPLPNIEEDLENLRSESENAIKEISAGEAENNAVNEEMQGQTSAPPTIHPEQSTEEEILSPSEPPPLEMALAYLRAFVTTGKGVLPIPNAQVIVTRITDDGQELLEQAVRTNISGYTPLFSLPAVSGIYSQTPTVSAPYTYYNMYVRANGFYPVRIRNIPMYGGVTAVQPVDLLPLAEGANPNEEQSIEENAPQNLS